MTGSATAHATTNASDIDQMLERFVRGELTLPAFAASCFEAGRIAASADRAVQILGAAQAIVPSPTNPLVPVVDPTFEGVVRSDTGQPLPLVRHDSPAISPAPMWFLIRASRVVTDREIEKLWHAAAYAWKASARGEAIGKPMRTDDASFYCEVDFTSSRRSDPADALYDFEDTLVRLVAHGSALRTTDKAGPGTKGTRAVDAFGDSTLAIDLLWPAATDAMAQDTQTPAVDEFGPATPSVPRTPTSTDF